MRGKKDDRISEVLKIQKIKNPQDLFQIIDCIYMYGRPCNEYGDKLADKLLCLLVGQPDKEYGYGREFFEFIIRGYSSNNREQEMLLAISGISDDYKNFSDAAECREKYLVYYNQKYTDKPVNDESGMRHREKKALRAIANKVYSSFRTKNDRSFLLCKEWMSERGIDISELGLHEDESESGMPGNEDDTEDNTKTSGSHPIIFIYNKIIYKARRNFVTSLIACAIMGAFLHNLNKPSIKSISVGDDDLTVIAGEHADPGIEIRPTEAGKGNLEYRSADKNIADMTLDLEVIGGNGWREDADNTTEIKLWGGNAAKAVIKVQLEPDYTDGAKDEEYCNQTDAGQYRDYNGSN